jgi:hypothetical protein
MKLHLIYLLPVMISCGETSKSKSEQVFPKKNNEGSTVTIVDEIKSRINQFDAIKFTDSVLLENEEFMQNPTDGGGSLTGYFHQEQLVKISEWIGLSYGIRQNDYYYDNGQLIFNREKEKYFEIRDNSTIVHNNFVDSFEAYWIFRQDILTAYGMVGEKRMLLSTGRAVDDIKESAKTYYDLIIELKKQ